MYMQGRDALVVPNFCQIKQLSQIKIGTETTVLYIVGERKCQFWHNNRSCHAKLAGPRSQPTA